MWDNQIAQPIAQALQLMLDPSSKKIPVDDSQKPAGVVQYRLADGTLVSYSEASDELKMTLFFPGGIVKVEVSCKRCRNCREYLFPDTGKYCSHCGAEHRSSKKTTLDREPFF